jgi:hypothetical protein
MRPGAVDAEEDRRRQDEDGAVRAHGGDATRGDTAPAADAGVVERDTRSARRAVGRTRLRAFGQEGVRDKVGEGGDQADGGVSEVRGPGRRGRVKTIFILQTLAINQSLENTLPRVK